MLPAAQYNNTSCEKGDFGQLANDMDQVMSLPELELGIALDAASSSNNEDDMVGSLPELPIAAGNNAAGSWSSSYQEERDVQPGATDENERLMMTPLFPTSSSSSSSSNNFADRKSNDEIGQQHQDHNDNGNNNSCNDKPKTHTSASFLP